MAEAGIGVDIVEISRMKSILEKTPRLLGVCLPMKSVRIAMPRLVPPRTMLVVSLLARRCLRRWERDLVQGVGRKDVSVTRDKLGKPKALCFLAVLSKSPRIWVLSRSLFLLL